MTTLQIIVPGIPRAKGRPRFSRGRVYTPKTTKRAETDIGWHAKLAMKGRMQFTAAVAVRIMAWMPKPKKTSYTYPIGDVDNIAKAVCDGLNGIVWGDDRQVTHLEVGKGWTIADARLVINVEAA